MILTIYTIFLCQTLARTFLRTFCIFCVLSLREFTCLRHEQCWLAGGSFFHVGAWATAIEKKKALPF